MTRKTDSTGPHPRWREEGVSPPIVGSTPPPPPECSSAETSRSGEGANAPRENHLRQERFSGPDAANAKATSEQVADLTLLDDVIDSKTVGWLERLINRRSISWLVSSAVHLLLLLLLALLTYHLHGEKGISIEGSVSDGSDAPSFQTVAQPQDTLDAEADSIDSPVAVNLSAPPQPTVAPAISETPADVAVENDFSGLLQSGGATERMTPLMSVLGGSMAARTPEGRKTQGDLYGATQESEAAVENALRWLADHQRADGSWSFNLQLDPCNGRCRHGQKENDNTPRPATAATGLALLAFLGAGYTPHEGPYQDTVRRGIYYLREAAVETERGYDWQQAATMYGHGIAMLAMSEALGMTKIAGRFDTDLLHYVDRGAYFTVVAQHKNGSWGYTPKRPGDVTLTGWQILSLIGARKAGISLRTDTFWRTREFLMSVRAEPEYQFGYNSPQPEPTTTAIALTILMYLGQTKGNSLFDDAVDKLARDGPTLTNVYHDYYATMALHHWRHPDWDAWNNRLRDHLVRTQESSGHEAGSWHFSDKYGDVGGRLYTTAMSTLILEVYYRYLPLYEKPPDFPL